MNIATSTAIVLGLVLFIPELAAARPGTTDAYEAAAEYKDDFIGGMHAITAAEVAFACGMRPSDWSKRVSRNVVAGENLSRTQYRSSVKDKARFDAIVKVVESEAMVEQGVVWQYIFSNGMTASGCLDIRRNTSLMQTLDYAASNPWGD